MSLPPTPNPELLPAKQSRSGMVWESSLQDAGMEWLAPLFRDGNHDRVLKVDKACAVLRCGKQLIYKQIESGALETIKAGHDYRVTKRSLLLYLWNNWSGKAKASHAQVTTFVLTLLAHLPSSALMAIMTSCHHLIERKRQSERSLGLQQPPTRKGQAAHPDLFSNDTAA